jgi:hypothetical protein
MKEQINDRDVVVQSLHKVLLLVHALLLVLVVFKQMKTMTDLCLLSLYLGEHKYQLLWDYLLDPTSNKEASTLLCLPLCLYQEEEEEEVHHGH